MGTRRRVGLVSLVAAEALSSAGSRISLLAVPWLVLVTTGSPTRMGLVAGAAAVANVLANVFGSPLIDRIGYRRSSVGADLGCAIATAGIAAGHPGGFPTLIALVAVSGALSGMADRAKRVLLAPEAERAGVPMARVTAVFANVHQTAMVVGASIGGVLIAWLGPLGAIWVDAVSFAVCALMVVTLVRGAAAGSGADMKERYTAALRRGVAFVRRERVIRAMVAMLFVTNLFNQASAVVFVPLWIRDVLHSPVALGWVSAAFAVGAITGGLVFIGLATRLPRYPTLVVSYLLGGTPRFLVLALSDDLPVVLAVSFLAGAALSSVNPMYGAMLYERVPLALQARVFGLCAAISFGGMPLGSVLGGWVVEQLGLTTGLFLAAGGYFAATTLAPLVGYRLWRQLDEPPDDADRAASPATPGPRAPSSPVSG